MTETFRRAYRAQGCFLCRGVPELQRLQRRCLRGHHVQGQPALDAGAPRAWQARPFRRRRRKRRDNRRPGERCGSSTFQRWARSTCWSTTRRVRPEPGLRPVHGWPTDLIRRRRSGSSEPSSGPTTAASSRTSWSRRPLGKAREISRHCFIRAQPGPSNNSPQRPHLTVGLWSVV